MRVVLEHVTDQVAQVLGVTTRNGRVVAFEDLDDEAFHVVGVEGVAQSGHFVQNAAETPNVGLLVVGLFLANLGRLLIGTEKKQMECYYLP